MLFDMLGNQRAIFLQVAIKDAMKWCVSPDATICGQPSDQFWIKLLGMDGGDIDETHAHRFLVTFKLTNRFVWNKVLVAQLMGQLRQIENFQPESDISKFAERLRSANTRGARQTSAASKISNFAKPATQVFIWDELASRSARFREWSRAGRAGRLTARTVYLNDAKEHDYTSFHRACCGVFEEEMKKQDFLSAADEVCHTLRKYPGPAADADRVPEEFIQRRLLDKLMYWEGWSLKYDLLPDAASI